MRDGAYSEADREAGPREVFVTPFQRFFIYGKFADFLLHFVIFVGGGSCLFFTFVWNVGFALGVLIAGVLYWMRWA